jgi:formate dehydrogenase subunit gamma
VGRRHLVVTVHIWTGVLIPLPYLLGLFSRAFRADLTLLGRFTSYDRDWLRAARRRQFTRPAGKFNAGQKLYAGWIAGAALVMLGTGLLMWLTHLTPVAWRTSATFVHDWLALTMGIVIAGHLWMALTHPESRHAMRTGHMNRHSATNEHPHWHP